jgi:hypothetical protein
MSAKAEVLRAPELLRAPAGAGPRVERRAGTEVVSEPTGWDATNFAREQIRGLARRLFLANGGPTVSQVVFCAADAETDVKGISLEVSKALALETRASVALAAVNSFSASVAGATPLRRDRGNISGERNQVRGLRLRETARQIAENLWSVSPGTSSGQEGDLAPGSHLHSQMSELRRDFDYSIVYAPSSDFSSEAALLGHLADGVVLILEAHRTRRATAQKIKETMEASGVRLLGTVLNGRTFPIPERIYRWL